MLIVPKEPPVFQNLNTYYLDVAKFIEHCQGDIGAGGVYFQSSFSNGILFFDHDEILNGYFTNRIDEKTGNEAVERLLGAEPNYNYSITLYKIPAEEVYFWASLSTAEKIYKDLSTEFTDLEGLVKKMRAEKITGFIDVSIGKGNEGGLIFISNGEIIGGSYSLPPAEESNAAQRLQWLLDQTKERGGIFQVSKIPALSATPSGGLKNAATAESEIDIIKMLEEFLSVFETLCKSKKLKNFNFNNTLKQKFVDMADRYAFLDPFAAEFEYKNRKIIFTGNADDQKLTEGVITAVTELAGNMGILAELHTYLSNWSNRYGQVLSDFGIQSESPKIE